MLVRLLQKKRRLLWTKEQKGIRKLKTFWFRVNQELVRLRSQLASHYQKVDLLHEKNASPEEFQELLSDVNQVRSDITSLENKWRDTVVTEAKKEEEGYALWDQEETTLTQLIMEYGAMDYLYVVPPEMNALKLNMHSTIPIPRESLERGARDHPRP